MGQSLVFLSPEGVVVYACANRWWNTGVPQDVLKVFVIVVFFFFLTTADPVAWGPIGPSARVSPLGLADPQNLPGLSTYEIHT